MLRALLGGELLPAHLRAAMLRAVDSDWPETGLSSGQRGASIDNGAAEDRRGDQDPSEKRG